MINVMDRLFDPSLTVILKRALNRGALNQTVLFFKKKNVFSFGVEIGIKSLRIAPKSTQIELLLNQLISSIPIKAVDPLVFNFNILKTAILIRMIRNL